jgi:outer membrane protein TolC
MQVFGSALNQQAFSPTLDFNAVPDADNFNVHGLLVLPLYAGGRNSAGRGAARAQADLARHTAEAVRETLAFEVARGFYTVHKTRAFIEATQAAVDAFATSLAIARRRLNAGTALKHEALDVEVRLAQAREDFLRATNAHRLALRAVQTLLGLEPDAPFAVDGTVRALEVPDPGAVSARAELQAARRQTEAVEAETRSARAGYRPRVNAFGRYDYDQGWELDGSGDSYTVGVEAQWDIWNGQRTRAELREAQARLEASREQERKVGLAIDFELHQARSNLDEASQRIAVTETAVALALESAQLTRARFEQGLALATQVIDAESALTGARVRRAEAEADHQIAIAALRKALGVPQLPSIPSP